MTVTILAGLCSAPALAQGVLDSGIDDGTFNPAIASTYGPGLSNRTYLPTFQPDQERFATLIQSRDGEAILAFLDEKAAAGETWAMMQLGTFFATGSFVERDAVRALNWFAAAARAGDERGALLLGLAYARGDILMIDEAKASAYLMQAAESDSYEIRRDASRVLALLD